MNTTSKLKNLSRTMVVSAALIICGGSAQAETASSEAQVAVVTPLSFIQVEDLDFGQVISGNTAGTVTISQSNVRTSTGGVIPVGNGFQLGKFVGKGSQNQRITFQIAPAIIVLLGPGLPMTITNLTVSTDGTLNQSGASSNYRVVPVDGIFWINLGGRLNVGANQAAGKYGGIVTATLIYE